MDQQQLKKAIVLTLAYSDQFHFPLSLNELHQRLLTPGHRSSSGHGVFLSQVAEVLQQLVEQKLVFRSKKWFSLSSGLAETAAQQRHIRSSVSHEKITNDAQRVVSFCSWLPWVCLVGVTGSVAVSNAHELDDIDFFIVTRPHTLWITRVALILFAWAQGKRRTWQAEESNSWCFNMWADENHLQVPDKKRATYTAYEILQVEWVYISDFQLLQKFYSINSWVHCILPSVRSRALDFEKRAQLAHSSLFQSVIKTFFMVILPLIWCTNFFMYFAQLWYMSKHRTREVVLYGFAGFHPRDTQLHINTGWLRSVQRWISHVSKN